MEFLRLSYLKGELMADIEDDEFWNFDEEDPIGFLKNKALEYSVLHPLGKPYRIQNKWISIITKDKSECQFILEEDDQMVHYYPKGSATANGKKMWNDKKAHCYAIRVGTRQRKSQMVIDALLSDPDFATVVEPLKVVSDTSFYLKTVHVLPKKSMALALAKSVEEAGKSYGLQIEGVTRLVLSN